MIFCGSGILLGQLKVLLRLHLLQHGRHSRLKIQTLTSEVQQDHQCTLSKLLNLQEIQPQVCNFVLEPRFKMNRSQFYFSDFKRILKRCYLKDLEAMQFKNFPSRMMCLIFASRFQYGNHEMQIKRQRLRRGLYNQIK